MRPVGTGLTSVQEVCLLGLRLRALDARSRTPILGDDVAVGVAEAIGMDLDTPALPRSVALVHAVRSATFDRVVRRFTTCHPDAVVLDLGCGLDARIRRCAPPVGVDWYDVDFPEVTRLRERLLPTRSHLIGTDLTTAGWLDRVPVDRPAMIVADGLHALLSTQSFVALTRTLTTHFDRGEFAFNAYSRLAMRNSRRLRGPLAIPTRGEGFDDAREPEGWDAGLQLLEELSMARMPEVASFPLVLRGMARITARSARLRRVSDRVVRYRL